MKHLFAAILALSVLGFGMTACNPPSTVVTGGITLLTSAGITAGLDFGIKDTAERNKVGGYVYTVATLTNKATTGTPMKPDDFKAYLIANGVKADPVYSDIAGKASELYATLVYPKILANPDAANVNAYLLAFSMGLQSGAAVYAPATVSN